MSTFSEELTIIRRFLRDPDGAIWSDQDICTYWNDALLEMARKCGYEERAHSYKYPPEWTFSYMRDWEHTFAEGDRYQCLIPWQARNAVVCYPWEAGYYLTNSSVADDGYRFIHPWEAFYGSPADYVPVPFHVKFHKAKFIAYDEQGLMNADRKALAETDSHYRTASGTPVNYWRPDDFSNQLVIYPRPASVTWDDGGITRDPTEALTDTGGIQSWDEAYLDEAGTGIITNTIDTENRLFMVFEAVPAEVPTDPGSWYQNMDWPGFLTKYVRYGTLERCFGADTDGFIPSLRDYWRLRKEVGIKAVKKFKALRQSDRTYRLGGGRAQVKSRHPRLPSAYPSQYP